MAILHNSDFEDHICKCGTKKLGYILSDDDFKLKKNYKNKKILKAVRNKTIVNRQHYSKIEIIQKSS